jgi:hypothetical protein
MKVETLEKVTDPSAMPASWLIESLVSVQVLAKRAVAVELKFPAVGLASR